jgi:succinylarginine dihydrolase
MSGEKQKTYEVNFDGLVGSTHNYGGLSFGNVASLKYKSQISDPRGAALQGLMKMKFLADLGIKQAVLPPQERPDFSALRGLGFSGTESQILEKASRAHPELLASCYSASSMWTANAATVSPSGDTTDKKVHFTSANLNNKFHRSIEPTQTARNLAAIFSNPKYFTHHPALPSSPSLGDEGAANHTRLAKNHGAPGLEVFVFGKYGFRSGASEPKKFPARQTQEASESIARLHQLPREGVCYVQQNPEAIDAGAFHNDVVSVGNQNLLFCHENAFLDQKKCLDEIKACYRVRCGDELRVLQVSQREVPLADAVQSYLFNSQLITLPNGSMAFVAPTDCQERQSVNQYLETLLKEKSDLISAVHFFDLKQSMRNGGGPACLRLRVVLNTEELAASSQSVYMDDLLFSRLSAWVKDHYRDQLSPEDLADPKLVTETRTALDELTQILKLGSVYPFQTSIK